MTPITDHQLAPSETALCVEYENWCAENRVLHISADEAILDETLTPYQRRWISEFINRWEKMLEAQGL